MKSMMDIGFWIDSGRRVSGIIGNMFRWIFATKRRLQLVILGVVVLSLLWGCGRAAEQRQGAANEPSPSPSATATGPSCVQPNAATDAEKDAANIIFRSCSVPNYPDTRRAAASRSLAITGAGASPAAPAPELVERFAAHLPNAVQQIGGADAQGVTTVLATSSASKFLLSFNAKGELVTVKDITETPDVKPTTSATPKPTPLATTGATPSPTPTATR